MGRPIVQTSLCVNTISRWVEVYRYLSELLCMLVVANIYI